MQLSWPSRNFCTLTLSEGSLLIRNPATINNPFYQAVPIPSLYIPVIILATFATIIASQAMISGAFSICQQAITLGTFPRMKVIHTSDVIEGQIYIPTLNFMLMIACIILVVSFQTSTALSNAYGLAVCGDMTLTTLMFSSVARFRWKWHPVPWAFLFFFLLLVDGTFLSSTLLKIPQGGFVPLIIATLVSSTMYIWRVGKASINAVLKQDQLPFSELQHRLQQNVVQRCPGLFLHQHKTSNDLINCDLGTAVFLSSLSDGVPVSVNVLASHIPYLPETVIFLTIRYQHVPYVKAYRHVQLEPLPERGFYRIVAHFGYRETQISMEQLFSECATIMPEVFHDIDLAQTSFFLSTEHVRIDKTRWFGHKVFYRIFKAILGVILFIFTNCVKLSYTIPHSFKIPNKSLIIMGSEVYL